MEKLFLSINKVSTLEDILLPFIKSAEGRILKRHGGAVLVVEREPYKFLGAFFAAMKHRAPCFLGNWNWREEEWTAFFKIIKPEVVFGDMPRVDGKCTVVGGEYEGRVMIPTGGTTSGLRFAMHVWESLEASARATASFLKESILNAVNVLPLYHVSGLMPAVRAYVTGGGVNFYELESSGNPEVLPLVNLERPYLSLVATQLRRLMSMEDGPAWLRQFEAIFVGGGAMPEALREEARRARIPCAPTYGATETASMVTLLRPDYFLQGQEGVGEVLPHAELFLEEGTGVLRVKASSLFCGYFEQKLEKRDVWETEDVAEVGEGGFWRILGRRDAMIITGGEKVDPREVEAIILSTGLVDEVLVVGQGDGEWGERVVALVVPRGEVFLGMDLKDALKGRILDYKIPKEFLCLERLPIRVNGKLDHFRLREVLKNFPFFQG